uniref:ribosomal protein S4 n=1 Tax=Rhodella violacea TaxID=2801 RepID=UPI001FCE152E|nr:ribosomal protein S4 [Rhodella violacea]UNJ18014.1 ribosomal protein S4 [Rhodella violacea]
MSRYIGPKLRVIRRLGNLPGLCRKVSRRAYPPGQHGRQNEQRSRKQSEYAIRLEEKQKLRFNYGLSEKQLLRYVYIAKKTKGSSGLVLLQLLEMRLDNIIFRLGMAPTIPAARQLVNHGHICVNDRVVSIGSFQCKPGDIISVKPKASSKLLVEKYLDFPGLANIPSHLEFNKSDLMGKVNSVIERRWIALPLNELLVVEFYSRK